MMLGKFRPTINADGTENWLIPEPDSYNTIGYNKGNSVFDLGERWGKIINKYNLDADGANASEEMFHLFNKQALNDAMEAHKAFEFTHDPIIDTRSLKLEYDYIIESADYMYIPKELILEYIGD